MGKLIKLLLCLAGLCIPACATVAITSLQPSLVSPQVLGTSITWTATATDSNPGPFAFQFNVAPPKGTFANGMARDFNVGTLNAGTWTSLPFVWVPTGLEGTYEIQVVVKDFTSKETATKTVKFGISPLVTGSAPVVVKTANPLVALFSAPSCAAGSTMRVVFQQQSKATPATATNYVKCHPPASMTFEVAGMYPSTAYHMFAQTDTGGKPTNGTTLSFTTGALPTNIPFPAFTVKVPPGPNTDTTDSVLLHNMTQFGGEPLYPDVATDLAGKIIWYYFASPPQIITRPLPNGTMLMDQTGPAWNSASTILQIFAQIDLAGNIIKQTNTGAIQQQLLAMGAKDAGPCNVFPSPAPVGSACLGSFHHDAIQQTLPNGDTAVLVSIEKIYPPGTQGNTSGLPVDIIGDMVVILDSNWQVKWYFDAFQHAGGAPQLDITRPAVLGGTCGTAQEGCPAAFLLGPGIAPAALDWLHCNDLYYWPKDTVGGASNDLLLSSRNQDWILKIDYNNGAGTGDVLWRMGPCGDFNFNNIYNDPWPWFSAQHNPGIANNGAGPLTVFDNGNTRISKSGSSSGCIQGVGSGDSRGMALTIDETPGSMQVTPVLSADLGVYSTSGGSAQLLSDGNYYFMPAVVQVSLNSQDSYSIEILPTAGTDTGTQVLNVQGPQGYRGWQMSSLYNPPTP